MLATVGLMFKVNVRWKLCCYFCRQLLLCRVTLGKSFLQFSAMKMAHAPPGHHSVIGRPSTGGLNYAEYVVYRGEQVSGLIFLLIALSYYLYCLGALTSLELFLNFVLTNAFSLHILLKVILVIIS